VTKSTGEIRFKLGQVTAPKRLYARVGVTVWANKQRWRKRLGRHAEDRVPPFAPERFRKARLWKVLRLVERHGHSAGCRGYTAVFRNWYVTYRPFHANAKRAARTSSDGITVRVFLHSSKHRLVGRFTAGSPRRSWLLLHN